ncbi:poly(hydroxyalcanoate) granule associated protein [Acinetobacter sp. TGL-Y2]|uniref:phasin family protein n=1 Tax=Acinetobacter sp. TGL-Y2 TaxID=1407071 RepID=UPI0007A6515B|nr:phasin family protein [Acinetobacter sp. TGL-Y2]AMW78955.1 poly(hydroxyalcanoate) granule associated protein [Acinetobacter sp. TGL-Y2]
MNNNNEHEETLQGAAKKPRPQRKSHLDFRKYTKQIWLAGLGAFSRAEEEGNKMFDSLVKVGEELESKTVELTDQTVHKVAEKTKESVTDTKDRVEKLLDQRVSSSLNRIGLVTAKDIQYLEGLILDLHSKVEFLVEQNQKLNQQRQKK